MYEINAAVKSLIQTEISVFIVIKVRNRIEKSCFDRTQLRGFHFPLFRLLLPFSSRSNCLFFRIPSRNDHLLSHSFPLKFKYSWIYFILLRWWPTQKIVCYSLSIRTQSPIKNPFKQNSQFMVWSRNFLPIIISGKYFFLILLLNFFNYYFKLI